MAMFSPSYGQPNMAKPGTTDPAYVRRRALIQQLQGQSAQYRPAHSAAEALARALTPMAYAWEGKIEDDRAADRDKRFSGDFAKATAGADPQKLADALAASENPDVAAYAPMQRIDDTRAAREASVRDLDWTRRTQESERDRAQRLQFHQDDMAMRQRQMAQSAALQGRESYSEPMQVMGPNGQPMLVRFGNRGGVIDAASGQRVSGFAPAPDKAPAPFAGNAIEAQAYNLVIRGQQDPAVRATPEYAAAWDKLYSPKTVYNETMGQQVTVRPEVPQGFLPPGTGGQVPAPTQTQDPPSPVIHPQQAQALPTPQAVPQQPAANQSASTTVTRVGPGRPLTPKDREMLTEAGSSVTTWDRLAGTFKDQFGGYGSAMLGDAVMTAKRNLTGDNTGAAQWWQDYQEQKNKIRNQLFGSALTATERTEFDKASISPGMRPEQIRENIARQRSAAARAAKKLSQALEADGFNTSAIDAALGMKDGAVGEATIPPPPEGFFPVGKR